MPQEKLNLVTPQQALEQVTSLAHQAFTGGNIDHEKTSFEDIIQKLSLHMISPEEAILQAQNIMAKRQDYH